MSRSTVFKNNQTQAIRVPKALAFPDSVKNVEITRQGNGLLITPLVKSDWETFFSTPGIDEDFLSDRNQDLPQSRKWK
ncbi:type II toxin-antitoxin system VapB family antitoxin [Aestuariivirga litoralis]|uniref:type II toxin-antitoxin system VapB family antitoxin n=1 Tax=Aestuariivirga litoralis TaxID=2650924 RepID=UPI0018C60224|nr:type II toxin-antitoxin system VapB family antitoxin [Aestuariivirga litoralis]MBG1231426.1 antitoxin [Aestuariivirga litoralis]